MGDKKKVLTVNDLKEMLIEARIESVKESIPHHNCPSAYYEWECPEELSESGDCAACRERFFEELEKQIREEVMALEVAA